MNVLITGAAGGLGRAMAVECARRGYRLFLTDVNADGLRCLQTGLERQFAATAAIKTCDLTNPESVDALLAVLDASGIQFDMLLNIAGVDFEGGFMERDRERVVKIVALNDAGTLRITHAILERRDPKWEFTAIFVSSLASLFPMPLKATYAASKRFLLDFALSLREELKGDGVNVLALCPAGMATTAENIQAIRAQGIWGEATTNPLERVARRTLDCALDGRAIYIPGTLNRLLSSLGKVVPRVWVAAIIHWRWKCAQRKWLNASGCAKA